MKTKSHTKYRLQNGTIVPGVTTPLGLLEKNAIHYWIARITKEGHDWTKYRDDKAEIGTLAHLYCLDYFMGFDTVANEFSVLQINQAENSAYSFFNWLKPHDLIPILVEGKLVSERYRYGGTVDLYCILDGKLCLLDLKTGSGIWDEYIYQMGGYVNLLEENGFRVDEVRILNIPRTEDEGFLEKVLTDKEIAIGWSIFQRCLDIYNLKKQIGNK